MATLPNDEADQFWQAITVIEAQEMLMALKVSDFPHYKKITREKLMRELHKQAYPARFENRKAITGKDLEGVLNG